MLTLLKVAITGGVASGKSTVCRFFKELGAYVVNADAIVHELLTLRSDLGQQVVRLLRIPTPSDEKRFREIIAERVFKDPNLLASLEKILHPAVLQKIEELFLEASKKGTYTYFVVEIPLLFEIENEKFYDVVVAVLSDEETARKRFEQSGFPTGEYAKRMQRQISPAKKAMLADYTLINKGSLEDLKTQVTLLNQTLQKNQEL